MQVYILPSLPDHSFLSPHLHIATILDSAADGVQVQARQPGFDLWQGHLPVHKMIVIGGWCLIYLCATSDVPFTFSKWL